MRSRTPTAPRHDRRTSIRVLLATVALAVAASVGGGVPHALAHTDVVLTIPAADETVAEPVDTITVAFADPVTLVGAGFEVFTPQEQIVQPAVATEDDTAFVLRLDPPLAGGVVGVRYEVVAADGHVIEGSFVFTVTAPAPAPTTAPVVTTAAPPAPATTVPSSATTAADVTNAPVTSPPATGAPDTSDEPAVVATPPTTETDDGSGGGSTGLVIGVALAAAVAVGAFVVLRTRLRSPA